MPPPAQPADRREPVPGLFALPGHLLRQLSPRARKVVVVVGALLLMAGVVTAIVLAPRIAQSNRERAAEQQRADARARAAERKRLAEEQRPRTGTLAAGSGAGVAIAGVEEAITRDARARLATGELHTAVRRADCLQLSRRGRRLLLGCTAVTSDVKASASSGGVIIGYPYRGAVSPATGRYAICKTSGRPGEGSYTHQAPVELPRACGGP